MRTRRGSLAPHSYGTKPGDGPGEGRPQLLLRANEWRSLLRTYSFLKPTYKFYTQIDTRHPPTPFVGERLKMSVLRRDGRTHLLDVSLLDRSFLYETSHPWIHHVEHKGVYKHLVQEPISKLSKCDKNHLQQQFRRKTPLKHLMRFETPRVVP